MNPRYLTAGFAIILFCLCAGSTFNILKAPARYTNAPGEQNCTACHTGTLNQGMGTLSLSGPTTYLPGNTYTFTLSVSDTSQSRFGFSGTFLDQSDLKAGSFNVIDPSFTDAITSPVGGNQREYIVHKVAHGKNSWSFEWTAPSSGTDTLKFYFTGNAANANSQTTGDNIYSNCYILPIAGTPPVVSVQVNDSTPCVGDTIVFIEQITGTASTLFWDFGIGSFPAGAFGPGPHEVSYSQTGNVSVSLIASNTFGTDTTIIPVAIFAVPDGNAGPPTAVCKGDTIQLNGTSSTGVGTHFQWTGQGFAGADTLANARVSPDSSGYFYLTVNTAECVGEIDSVLIEVKPLPSAMAIYDTTTSLCLGDSIPLKAVGSGAGPDYTFTWTTSDPVTLLTPNDSITLAIAQDPNTTVIVTPTSDGCSGTPDTAMLSFFPLPEPTFFLLGSDTLTTQTFVTYQWFFYDTLTQTTTLIPGATDRTFPFFNYSMDSTNTGFVLVQVTDSNGCTGNSERVEIPLINPMAQALPTSHVSVFVPSGTAFGTIFWQNTQPGPATFLLFDINGRKVFEDEFRIENPEGNFRFSTAGLAAGYFLYQVRLENDFAVGKVVIGR